jgi:tetrahydromethanopterin S-methyltransferase subunit H
MFKFECSQKVYRIGNVEIGGHPGQRPTVMVGSIFFQGHRIVSDPRKGTFNRDKARALLEREAEISERTGNPRFIDVIGDTGQALIGYLEFVASCCDAPLLVDSSVPQARMEAVRHFKGSAVAPRLIYNAIDPHFSEQELECLKECGLKSAVVQPFGNRAVRPKDRIRLLEEVLLPAAERGGIENVIVDVGVLDIPSVSWAAQTIREIKDRLGYPCGCAAANALYLCEFLRASGTPIFEAGSAAVFTLPQSFGADYVFYGPMRNASWAYGACGMMDAMLAYNSRNLGYPLACDSHPLHQIV